MKKAFYFDVCFIILFVIKLIGDTIFTAEITIMIEMILYGYATLKMSVLLYLYFSKKKTHT